MKVVKVMTFRYDRLFCIFGAWLFDYVFYLVFECLVSIMSSS